MVHYDSDTPRVAYVRKGQHVSREDKARAKAEHAEAMRAYYEQNGQPVPRRYQPRADTTPDPSPDKDSEHPGWRDRMTASEREAIEFADELARTRGIWQPAARALHDKEARERAEWRADIERNERFRQDDTPREMPIWKGNQPTMTHKEQIIATLVSARDTLTSGTNVVTNAHGHVDDAIQAIVHVENEITAAAGYTAQAYGATSLADSLARLSGERETVLRQLQTAAEALDGLNRSIQTVSAQYDDAIAREQAID